MLTTSRLLPIGSVVLLKDGNAPIMIFGRLQKVQASNEIKDYIGCLYPYGNLDWDHTYSFDHENIDKLLFIGYQTPEEEEMQRLFSRIKEEGLEKVTAELNASVSL